VPYTNNDFIYILKQKKIPWGEYSEEDVIQYDIAIKDLLMELGEISFSDLAACLATKSPPEDSKTFATITASMAAATSASVI
jgi:hypothetical protein